MVSNTKRSVLVLRMKMRCVCYTFCLTVMMLNYKARGAIELSTNVTFSDPRSNCLTMPVEFLCEITDTETIQWSINSALIRAIPSSQLPNDDLLPTSQVGMKYQLVSVTPTGEGDRANMTSRLVIDPSTLRFDGQISCGTNAGEESLNYTGKCVHSVPEQPVECVSVPVYDQKSKRLITIQNTWQLANPNELGRGLSQDVFSYHISFKRDGISRGSKNVLATDVCRAGRCEYDLSTSFFGSYYTLSVAAENIVGLGEYLTCTPQEISTTINTNNMVHVVVNSSVPEHATVECQPLPVSAMCGVCYGISPNCHNLTCLEPVYSSDDGQAVLTLPKLGRGLRYCYEASVINGDDKVLVVQGTFSTDCEEIDLVYYQSPNIANIEDTGDIFTIIIDERCPQDSAGSLSIPTQSGVVCYSGTSLGSTAIYICDDDYLIPGHSDCSDKCNQRECQADGHWSGETLPCLHRKDLFCQKSCDVGISLCFITLLVAGVITTMIFALIVRHIFKRARPGVVSSGHHTATSIELPNYVEYAEDLSDLDEETCDLDNKPVEQDPTCSKETIPEANGNDRKSCRSEQPKPYDEQ